jgi:hypothetical protein
MRPGGEVDLVAVVRAGEREGVRAAAKVVRVAKAAAGVAAAAERAKRSSA